MLKFILTLTLTMVLACVSTEAYSAADPNANATTVQLLTYLQGLKNAPTHKMLTGQTIWRDMVADNIAKLNGTTRPPYDWTQLQTAFTATGQYPAIATLVDQTSDTAKAFAIDHWNNGGLIQSHILASNDPERWYGHVPLTNAEVTAVMSDPRYIAILDQYVSDFLYYQSNGVVILNRLYFEMNGNWNWFSAPDPNVYKTLWIHFFNYMTSHGVHNLLYYYCPSGDYSNYLGYYPGDQYVDIVGFDVYKDLGTSPIPLIDGYTQLSALNKPLMIGEYGFFTLDLPLSYQHRDSTYLLQGLKNNMPNVIGVNSWTIPYNISSMTNPSTYMNDSYVQNRPVPFQSAPPPPPPPPTTLISENFDGLVGTDYRALIARGWDWLCAGVYQDPNPCPNISIEHTITHDGDGALRYTYQGPSFVGGVIQPNSYYGHSWIAKSFTPTREGYEAYWLRFEPNPSGSPPGTTPLTYVNGEGNSSMKMHYFNTGGLDPYSPTVTFAYSGVATNSITFGLQNPTEGYPSVFLQPSNPINLVAGQWYCVETHQKLNTPGQNDGMWRIWINGILSLNQINYNYNNNSNDALRYIQLYRQDAAEAMYRYEDGYTLSTSRIGCNGVASPPDTTPPPQTSINSITTDTTTAIINYASVVDDNAGTITYHIERSPAGCASFVEVGTTTTTSFTDTGLSPNTSYCWRVKAYDTSSNFSTSAQSTATTQLPTNPSGLGISNGMFTIGGVFTFLPSFSYFDVMNWRSSDIDTMFARGWKGARIFVDYANDDGTPGDRTVCTAAGALQSAKVATVNAFLDYMDSKGMVTTMVILNQASSVWMTSDSARQTCVANVVNAFKTRSRIKFDVVQEFDYSFTGNIATSLTVAQVGAYNVVAKTACSGCIVYSSASSPLTHPQDLTATIVGSVITQMTQNSQDVIAIHDYPSSNWWAISGSRVTAYRNWLTSINKANVPVIFDKPNRYGATYSSSELEFNQAARDAKNAGAAEWVFHSAASFNMATQSMMAQLGTVEDAVSISLVASLTFGNGNEVPEIVGSDTFTRADSTDLGPDWEFGTEYNSLQIVSNSIRPLNTVVGSLERYIGSVLPNNQGIRGKLVIASGVEAQTLRLNVRLDSFPNYNGMYCAFNRNSSPLVSIVKRVTGIPSVLASTNAFTIAQDDVLACEGYGTLYRALQNGVVILQVTDGTYTAGAPGIYMSTAGATANFGFDNVETYRFVPPVPQSLMATVTTDATGANLTFTSPAYKIRYWNTDISNTTPVEVSGLGGVMSYRHNIVHMPTVTYQCYQSQGINGVWETDTWICADVTPGDIVPPRKPKILSID